MELGLKITKNSNKFREPAIHFEKFQTYTFAPPGTSEYIKYWTDAMNFCLHGFQTKEGDSIPGYFYFYLNYFTISLQKKIEVDVMGKKIKKMDRVMDFPRFYDYDRYFFDTIQECENQGKHLIVLKARRKGYSYKVAAMLCRNYYLIRESHNYALASEAEFLIRDGILTKAWDGMDFIDANTAWYKKRHKADTKMHKRASYIQKDDSGVPIEMGYKSEIMGVTLKNDPQKARGKQGRLIIFEEAGKFPNLLQAWQIARPSVEQGSNVLGMMIAFGTGGTLDADYEGLRELFENPEAYGCLVMKNIWDDHLYDTDCGFFVPQYVNLEGLHPESKQPFMDADGNTLYEIAKGYVLDERDKVIKNASDRRAIDRHIAEQPCFVGDTLISTDKGVCDIKDHVDAWITGKKQIYEIITQDGVKIKLTENHELYNGKEYKPLSEYKVGEVLKYKETIFKDIYRYVEISGIIPSLNTLLKIDEDWAQFLGLYMGDGSYYARGGDLQIVFDVKDKESYEWYNLFANKKLGKSIITNLQPKANMVKVNTYNKKALTIYNNLSMLKQKEDGTHVRKVNIPDYIMKSPKSVVASFLRGLFDADGHSTSNGKSVGIGLKQLEVLEQVQFLLRGFDIHAKVSSKDRVNSNGYFYKENKLNIRSIDIPKFKEYIGFISKRKLDNITESSNRLVNRDYTYGTIISIEKQGLEEVWDVATKDHTLSANGIWAHNCTPAEAVLNISSNIFPKSELKNHLSFVRNHVSVKEFKQVGELVFNEKGKPKWVQNPMLKAIVKFPLKPEDDKRGAIVVWEHPVEDAPYGLYIIGCLLPGEKVLTNKGLVNVEDVIFDDKLINKDGKLVDIINFQKREKVDHDTYRFKMSHTYRTTAFTRGHPIYISKTGYNTNRTINENKFDFSFTRADQLDVGNWTKYPNVYRNLPEYDLNSLSLKDNIRSIITSEDFWWFVGLWLGDGCYYNNILHMSFNKDEDYYIEKYKRIVKELFGRSPYVGNRKGKSIQITFGYKELGDFLTEHFGKYAHGKLLPEWVKRLTIAYKKQLILGYLDSDGCITKHTKGYYQTEFVSVSLELLESIQDLLFSIKVISSLTKMREVKKSEIQGRKINQKDTYHLRLSHHSTLDLVEILNDKKDIKIQRINFENLPKVRTRPKDGCFFSKDYNYIYFQIKNIEHNIYTGPVYNFECVTHNYISHHISQKNCDPYDHDSSTTDSLGSAIVYKRIQTFESYYDLPVAEYTGRPDSADEFYEKVRLLAFYFNAKILYENEKKGLFSYFSHKHCEYLLADQPNIIKDIIKDSKVQRVKGIHMNKQIKQWGEGLVKDWLNEEYAPGKKNLTKIYSEPLLEELISYNPDRGNYDRVMSFMMVMIYIQELYHVNVKKKKAEAKKNILFKDGIFRFDEAYKLII